MKTLSLGFQELQNDRLLVISDSRCNEPRTSTPLFDRKTSRRSNDVPEDYKKFREGLEKHLKKNLVLNRGVKMSLPPDESFISGECFFCNFCYFFLIIVFLWFRTLIFHERRSG